MGTTMTKAIKSLALALATGLLATGATIATASADSQMRYDRMIEEAVASRLKEKLGGMRGTLEIGATDAIYPPIGLRMPDGSKSPWLMLDEFGSPKTVMPVWG